MTTIEEGGQNRHTHSPKDMLLVASVLKISDVGG